MVPAVRCSAFVLPLPMVHVTVTLLPVRVRLVMRNAAVLLVGSVPARNSCRLLIPSPSASALARFGLNGSRLYCCFQPFGMLSPTALRFGSSTSWLYTNVPPVRTRRAQALVTTSLSTTTVPALRVKVPLRTSSTAVPPLVTYKLPPVTLTIPVDVHPTKPTVMFENTLALPPDNSSVPVLPALTPSTSSGVRTAPLDTSMVPSAP